METRKVNLRQAEKILAEQGIEIVWDENNNLEDFFFYYDNHYKDAVEEGKLPKNENFFFQDIKNIFSE